MSEPTKPTEPIKPLPPALVDVTGRVVCIIRGPYLTHIQVAGVGAGSIGLRLIYGSPMGTEVVDTGEFWTFQVDPQGYIHGGVMLCVDATTQA